MQMKSKLECKFTTSAHERYISEVSSTPCLQPGFKVGQGCTGLETQHPLICLVYATCGARPRTVGETRLLSWTTLNTGYNTLKTSSRCTPPVALCRCQCASKVISPFIIFAVSDVSFRHYKL